MNGQPGTVPAALTLRVREILRQLGEETGDEPPGFEERVLRAAEGLSNPETHAPQVAARLLADRIKKTRFELNERVLELESLYDLGLSVAGELDVEKLADEILFRSISLTNSRSGALHLLDQGRVTVSRSFGGPLLSPESAPRIELCSDGMINNAASSQPICGEPVTNCEKCLVVPIQREGRRLGILVVADKETREGAVADFVPSDARLLGLFASQAATAVETARLHREAVEKERLERELELAASIQREILPRELPEGPGLSIAARTLPTRQVGGDYFDALRAADGSLVFVVADVSGKGVPAALLVSTLSTSVHLQLDEARDPADLVSRLHRHLFRFSRARKFVTMFLGRFHPGSGDLDYVSAGHNPAIWLTGGGEIRELPATGRPAGMFPDSTWTTRHITLARGDRLCVYSDGITEAQNSREEEFGMPRLKEVLEASRQLDVAGALEDLFQEITRFADGAPQYDDETALILSR